MIKNKYYTVDDTTYIIFNNTQNICMIDSEDLELLGDTTWYEGVSEWSHYAKTYKNNKEIKMHRLIMRINDPKIHIDHIDGNTLNNKKENLRLVDNAKNHMNQRIRKDNQSGYKGVSKTKSKKNPRWVARIGRNGKFNLGTFDTPEDAAKAYDKKAKELFGEFAKLNFPDDNN